MVGKPVQYDELLVTVFICVIGGLLLIVGLGIYFENELTRLFFGGDASSAAKPAGGADDANGRRASVPAADPSGAGGGGAADQSANGGGAGFGSWGSPKRPGDRRVYSNGVRLEELLRWPAVDACRALHAYALEMSGEDTEAFFSALPQITNCVLGLDHANGALNKGWLNQQALLLIEPQRNPRLALQLQAALFDLLTAQPAAAAASAGTSLLSPLAQGATRRPGQPGSLFGYLVSGRQGVGGAMRYTFFPKHLPRPARVALEQGRPNLVPPLFSARLQQQNAQAPNQGYGGASPPAAGAPPAEALLVLSGCPRRYLAIAPSYAPCAERTMTTMT